MPLPAGEKPAGHFVLLWNAAPAKVAPDNVAPVKSTASNHAESSFAAERLAFTKPVEVRLVRRRSAPAKFAPVKS